MKKVTFIAIAAFFTLSLASCKKDWSCKCTVTVGGASSTIDNPINGATKKDAEDACTAFETSATSVGISSSSSCELSKK